MRIHRVFTAPDADVLADAAACIRAGGVIIFPTDTVYGIGCAAGDDRAVEKIFALKHRPTDKPLAIHAATPAEATAYADTISPAARALIDRFWPGPLTIIVQRSPDVSTAAARGGKTIALRCPDDDACRAILAATGPLAATSANRSGAVAYDGGDDVSALPEADLAMISGPTKKRMESTIVDCSTGAVRILRQGALAVADIADTLFALVPAVTLQGS